MIEAWRDITEEKAVIALLVERGKGRKSGAQKKKEQKAGMATFSAM